MPHLAGIEKVSMTLLRSPQRTSTKVPAHLVVFSELSPQAKVQYTRFLIENQIKFERRTSDGKYVADVRLIHPTPTIKENNQLKHQQKQQNNQQQLQDEEEEEYIEEEELIETREKQQQHEMLLAHVPLSLHRYAKLIHLVGVKTYETSKSILQNPVKEAKIMRLIHDIYDARYDEYLNKLSTDDPQETVTEEDSEQFAAFVWQFLVNQFGLKKLIEQQTWQLIQGISMRSHRLDCEMFSMFLQGMYTFSELIFFLKSRASIHKALSTVIPGVPLPIKRSTSSNKQSTPTATTAGATTWLSKAQFTGLAHLIFGTKTSKMNNFLVLMQKAKAYLVTQNAGDQESERVAGRLFEVNEFLFLALETFHEAQAKQAKERRRKEPQTGKCPPPPVSSPNNQMMTSRTTQMMSKVTNIQHRQHQLFPPPPPPPPPSIPPQRTMPSAASVRMMVTHRPTSHTSSSPPPPLPPPGPPPSRLQVRNSRADVDDVVLSRVASLLERMKTRRPVTK